MLDMPNSTGARLITLKHYLFSMSVARSYLHPNVFSSVGKAILWVKFCLTSIIFVVFSVKDVDECVDPNTCDKTTSTCENSAGSFDCVCLGGHEKINNECVGECENLKLMKFLIIKE